MNNISRLEKRAIEASALAPLIRKLSEILGQKDARSLLRDINQKEAYERGRNMAQYKQGNSIEILAKDVATWGEDGAWKMDVLEQTPTTYFFNVTRCPYYEKYRELGLEEFGVEFSCCRDEPFARGFHPQLKLERSQTIMEGAEYCDFRYTLHTT
jgi:hypothetical protein